MNQRERLLPKSRRFKPSAASIDSHRKVLDSGVREGLVRRPMEIPLDREKINDVIDDFVGELKICILNSCGDYVEYDFVDSDSHRLYVFGE